MRLLWAVDHGLRSVSKQMQRRLGITGPQRLALRFVSSSPLITPSELAAVLHLDRGTLTGILERLVEAGLLVRQADPDDGRRVRLALSARGRRLESETSGTLEDCIERALASQPRARVEAAKQVLEAVVRELSSQLGA
jgi:MarR family transcriptional regulator, organic hydroperoxide resistance regulator